MRNRKAWLMWGLLLPTYFVAFFHRTSLSPLADELAVAFGLRESVGTALGTLVSVYFFVYMFLQIPSGIVADTIGARITVSAGSALMGIGTIAFAWAPGFHFALVARFLIGFGAAFNFIALLRQQVNWFDKRHFPLLTALVVVTGNIGALCGIGPFAMLAQALGWRTAMTIPGVLCLVFAVIIGVWVRNNPPDTPSREAQGHFLDGLKAVLAVKSNYLTFIVFGFSSGIQLTFGGFWGVPFLMHVHGLTKMVASGCTTILMLGVAAGCLVTPWLVKRMGSTRDAGILMLSVTGVLWAVVFYAPLPVHSPILLYAIFIVLGFFLSGFILPYTTVRETNPESAMGTALAFTNTGGFLTIAVLQVVVGLILDRFIPAGATHGMPVYPAHAYHVALGLLLTLHVIAVFAYAGVSRHPQIASPEGTAS